MRWSVAAPFIDVTNVSTARWINDFVPGNEHQFKVIPRSKPIPKWHDRRIKVTTVTEWMVYWKHASNSLAADTDGVITVFPQLAAAAGLQRCMRYRRKPVVGWLFNVGECKMGLRQKLARLAASNVDLSIVHTRREIDIYSEWLQLPRERFEFVPYQVPELTCDHKEDEQARFVTAMGTAHRDFPTLLGALKKLNIKAVIATGQGALQGCDVPSGVETPTGLSKDDCVRIAHQATINIVPLMPKEGVTAAGQITIAEAMMMGRPLIVTNIYGAEDYVTHGETGWLVEPNSVDSMTEAIDTLWNDPQLRRRIGENAQAYAKQHFTDEAAGRYMKQVLDRVGRKHGFIV